jgi:hypothetical protein
MSVEHETTTDAGTDGDVKKIVIRLTGTQEGLADGGCPDVRFDYGWRDAGQSFADRLVEPVDAIGTEELAVMINEFAYSQAHGTHGTPKRDRFNREFTGQAEDIIENGLSASSRQGLNEPSGERASRRELDESGGDFCAADVEADDVGWMRGKSVLCV